LFIHLGASARGSTAPGATFREGYIVTSMFSPL
jgi:hypothetical protein